MIFLHTHNGQLEVRLQSGDCKLRPVLSEAWVNSLPTHGLWLKDVVEKINKKEATIERFAKGKKTREKKKSERATLDVRFVG